MTFNNIKTLQHIVLEQELSFPILKYSLISK